MPDGLKAGWSAIAVRIAAAVGRLSGALRAQVTDQGAKVGRIGHAAETVDAAGARGIAALPAMRELLARPEQQAREAIQVSLNGHYGRAGKDGMRLYLEMDDAKYHQDEVSLLARDLHASGLVFVEQGSARQLAGSLELGFGETKQGTLVADFHYVKLEKHARGQGFTRDVFLRLRDYWKRSGVGHVNTWAYEDGAVFWAGVFDWHPDRVVSNRESMLGRIDQVMARPDHADHAVLRELQSRFGGPPESWPSTGELRTLRGETGALGEQILRGSSWYGIHKL